MTETLREDIAALASLSLDDMRTRWRQRLNIPLPAHRSKDLLIRAYLYALQSRASGGLKRETKRKLDDLAVSFGADHRFRPSAANPAKPGSVYVREWNGRRYGVTTTETGFLLDGQTYPSLTAVAFAITGVKWSGPRFFRETRSEAAKR